MIEPPSALGAVFAFIGGACVGSFVNVVGYRLPRELSIVTPGSMCPSCAHPIPIWLNIPILSYLALRGRCLMCRAPIPMRYPATELALAAAAFYLYLAFAPGDAIARFTLCAAIYAASLIDYDWRIIPDAISLPGIPAGFLAASFLMPEIGWKMSLYGILLGGGVLFGVGELYRLLRNREGMGMGDVKLMAMIGAFLGWPAVLFTLFVGSILGSVGGVLVGLYGRRANADPAHASESVVSPQPLPDEANQADVPLLQTTVPFGPFLSFAAAIYTLFQPQLTRWYLSG
jgi:leader peptidase (prepilin peptidase)/N-methyltransferase